MIRIVRSGKSVAALAAIALIVGASFASGTVPKGWLLAGSAPNDYRVSADEAVRHGGKSSALLEFVGKKAEGFGTLMQIFSAENYRGKRLRLIGWIKTENADTAQMWLRLDGDNKTVGFDNMQNRLLRGTQDWKKCEIVLDVPADAVNIAFGFIVSGTGKAWADDFKFDIVDEKVAVTAMELPVQRSFSSPLKQPANMAFDD